MIRPVPPDPFRLLDEQGWIAVPDVATPPAAAALAEDCEAAMVGIEHDLRVGDKAAAGTRRLVELRDRVPHAIDLFEHPAIVAAVAHLIGPGHAVDEVTFRSPRPGFGEQRLHADAVPMLTPQPWQIVTTIVALCDFTEDNGATGLLPGSHRRPDLQRRSGNLERHDDEIVLLGRAGTAFVFNGHVLHRGRRNTSAAPRPALQACWRP